MAAPAAAAKVQPAQQIPIWTWEGKTKTGEVKKGQMEAADEASVQQRLRAMALQNVKIRKKGMQLSFKLPGIGGISQKDIVIFTRQFATMIDAGLPLVQCLDILASQLDNLAFREVLTKVKVKVESGSTLADALKDHPKVFDTLFVQLVAAGEIGGILDTILNRLAAYIEKNEKLKSKVKGAMVYPSIVLTVAIGVIVVLLLFVTPTFEKMFGVGEATGAMDQMLSKIADFYDDEVDAAVAALTSMIEPIMMVFLGGIVGGFLIAMYLPIFSIAGAVK